MRRLLLLLIPLLAMARPRIPIALAPTTMAPPSTPPPGVDPSDYHPAGGNAPTNGPDELPPGPPPGVSQDDFDRLTGTSSPNLNPQLIDFMSLLRNRLEAATFDSGSMVLGGGAPIDPSRAVAWDSGADGSETA